MLDGARAFQKAVKKYIEELQEKWRQEGLSEEEIFTRTKIEILGISDTVAFGTEEERQEVFKKVNFSEK